MDFFRAGAGPEPITAKARGDIVAHELMLAHDLILVDMEGRAPLRSAVVERDWIAGRAAVEDELHGPARDTRASRQRWHNGCRERHAFSVLCGILVGFHRCPSRAGDEFFRGFIALREAWVNFQLGQVVIGGQAEWDWSNARGGNSFSCPGDSGGFAFAGTIPLGTVSRLSSFGCEARVNSIFTATARIGYAFDRLLIYGQGGLAAGDIDAKTVTANLLTPSIASPATTASASKTSVGWTIGAGFEYGLTQNISAKAEYLYFDLGSDTYNLGMPVAINRTGNIGRVGLNYRFNLM
jgi:opacity protein-like surface antigen